jgi:cytochrome P450
VFSPKAVAALRDNIRALANDVLDKVVARGHCDAVPDIAEPLHITVFLALLGLPLERLSEFREIIKKFKAPYKHHLEMIDRLCMVVDAMRDVILARRERPENDLISMLWQTEIDGRPMTYDDMENYAVILFTAGLDTVVNGMAFGIRHLANDLALQERLRAEPQLIAEATEELLRRYTFVMPPRIVARDATFRGCTMKRGDRVMLLLPAANLDEQAFPDPEQYLLDREKKAHIAFGLGAHRCVGSHLARIELQELYDVMLARLPQFRAAPDKPAQFHPGHVVGIHSLPIVWNVG